MEQTNLVVTADGKTWDEVTRDVSYIGPNCLYTTTNTATTWSTYAIMDEWRGSTAIAGTNFMNKDFAIAHDRVICLVDGFYRFNVFHRMVSAGDMQVYYNGSEVIASEANSGSVTHTKHIISDIQMKRGDYLQVRGEFGTGDYYYNNFSIIRLNK